jgi:hypothetical protein
MRTLSCSLGIELLYHSLTSLLFLTVLTASRANQYVLLVLKFSSTVDMLRAKEAISFCRH